MSGPRNIDPTFTHAFSDEDTDIRAAARRRGDLAEQERQAAKLQHDLAETAMRSLGVCLYCLQPFADHRDEREVFDHQAAHAEAFEAAKRLEAQSRTVRRPVVVAVSPAPVPPRVLTVEERELRAITLAAEEIIVRAGAVITGKIAVERAKAIIAALRADGLLS